MQVINGQCPTQVPQGLGASEKPVPTPPRSAPAGGEVRRGCLSPKGEFRAGRLLGAAQGSRPRKRATGLAGSPSLPTFLATQESRLPAGAEAGFRGALLRAAGAGRVCKPGRGKRPGQSLQELTLITT